MEPYSVFMFAAVTLSVSLLISRGETGLIRTFSRTKVKNRSEYAKFLGKSVAAAGVSFVLSGIFALFTEARIALAILAVSMAAVLTVSAKRFKKYFR